MKRLLSVLLVTAVILSQTLILVNAQTLSDGITKTQEKYEDYITEAISKSEFEENQIDKDDIFIVELTNPMAIKNNSAPLIIYVALPISDTEDISYAGFEKDKYVTAITNFSSLASIENPYGNKLKQYVEDNNLSEPTEIKILQIIERLHLFAYYVVCDNTEYIIPYHFTNESNFNITNDDECNLEYGKAYTVNEFNSICDKEQVLFEEERKKQAESEEKNYVDNDGEAVEQKAEAYKTDSVKDDKETYEKAEQKDTAKELFTADELSKIPTKEIKKNYHSLIESIDSSEWATDYILECIERGFLNDISELNYKEPITREIFCEIVYNMLSKSTDIKWSASNAIPFNDTYNPKVAALCYAEVIKGKTEKQFAPDDFLTREEAATILWRLFEKGYIKTGMGTTAQWIRFADENQISDWALVNVQNIYKVGVMDGVGDNKFAPKETYTAEQAITTIMRLCSVITGV